MLMDRDATLVCVAEKLGCKNQYLFIRRFKSVTGITPGTYRKENEYIPIYRLLGSPLVNAD